MFVCHDYEQKTCKIFQNEIFQDLRRISDNNKDYDQEVRHCQLKGRIMEISCTKAAQDGIQIFVFCVVFVKTDLSQEIYVKRVWRGELWQFSTRKSVKSILLTEMII